MTREEIKQKLLENPSWEPSDDATDEEWDIYAQVKRELGGDDDSDNLDDKDIEYENDEDYEW